MLRRLSLTLIPLALVLGCGSRASSEAPVSKPGMEKSVAAPTFDIEDLDGRKFALADQKGSVVLLDFWATWCPPCVASIPAVKKLAEDYEGKKIQIASISLDESEAAVRQFVIDHQMRHRIIFAGKSGIDQIYGIREIPTFVLIDKEGKVVNVWKGFDPGMADAWKSEIDRLLKA